MPSSVIEGTYRENNMTLNTSRRHVIATSGPDRYLVSLAVTTARQAVAAANATDAIVNGFRVAAPAAAPHRPGLPAPATGGRSCAAGPLAGAWHRARVAPGKPGARPRPGGRCRPRIVGPC